MTIKAKLDMAAHKIIDMATKPVARLFDHRYLLKDLDEPVFTRHLDFVENFARHVDRPGVRVLEIGSREVTGRNTLRAALKHAEYVGFDLYDGPNVDVAGDAHYLSDLIEGRFDAIYCSAVFEHLAMPWIVAEQIAKVMNVGGKLGIETHFSYSAHERPWNFFQFSDMALRALFSPALGFRTIEATMQNPIVGRFSRYADEYLRFSPVSQLYCHSSYFGEKTRDVPDFDWRRLKTGEVVDSTTYPKPGAE